MEGFKEQLKQELEQHAPFTNEMKQRLLQTKRPKSKINWPVLSVFIAACCLIGIMIFTLLPTSNQSSLAEIEEPALLPIIDVTNEKVIDPKYALLLGKQWMLHFLPMVIDEESSFSYGDYVAYYGRDGLVVSTVLGLEKDTVKMEQGKIVVNEEILRVRGLGDSIGQAFLENPFKNPYYFFKGDEQKFIDQTVTTTKDELVVYDFNEGHTISKIEESQLVGKVVAIQNFNLTFELSPEELEVYEAFKVDHNLERLKNISALAMTKMFLFSDIEKDYEIYETLFTTVENDETMSVKSYYERTKLVRQELFTEEVNRLIIANLFAGLENAQFNQESETKGFLTFTNIEGMETSASMEKNEQGLWQPAFSRSVY